MKSFFLALIKSLTINNSYDELLHAIKEDIAKERVTLNGEDKWFLVSQKPWNGIDRRENDKTSFDNSPNRRIDNGLLSNSTD